MPIINNYLTIYGENTELLKCIHWIRNNLQTPLLGNFKNLDIILVSYNLDLSYLHLTSINHNIIDWLTDVSIKFTKLYFNLVVSINNNYESHTLQQGVLYTATVTVSKASQTKKPSDTEFIYHHLLGHPFM